MYGQNQKNFAQKHPIMTRDKLDHFKSFDGYLFGVGSRFGMMSAQMKAFFDGTGGLWQSGALVGKPAGFFFCSGSQGGGQETVALTAITQLAAHGMVYVPIMNFLAAPGPHGHNR